MLSLLSGALFSLIFLSHTPNQISGLVIYSSIRSFHVCLPYDIAQSISTFDELYAVLYTVFPLFWISILFPFNSGDQVNASCSWGIYPAGWGLAIGLFIVCVSDNFCFISYIKLSILESKLLSKSKINSCVTAGSWSLYRAPVFQEFKFRFIFISTSREVSFNISFRLSIWEFTSDFIFSMTSGS